MKFDNIDSSQRKFDFVAIMPHSCGRSAFTRYLIQCDGVRLLYPRGISIANIRQWLDASPFRYEGLVLDDYGCISLQDLVNVIKPQVPVLLLSRDPIDQMKSWANIALWDWANMKHGVYKVPAYSRVSASELSPLIDKAVNYPLGELGGNWYKILEFLRLFSSSVTVVQFKDLVSPGAMPGVMRNVGMSLFNNPAAWSGVELDVPLTSTDNRIFFRLRQDGGIRCHATKWSRERFTCSLSFWPCKFWEFMKEDVWYKFLENCGSGQVASYSPKSIGWKIGNFSGDLGLYCKPQEIVASGLSPQNFIQKAKSLMETDYMQEQVYTYSRELNKKWVKANETFNSLKMNPDQIIAWIRKMDSSVMEQCRHSIRSQTEALASFDIDVTQYWTSSKKLMAQDDFSRPDIQFYIPPLVEFVMELHKKNGELERELDASQRKMKRMRSSISWKMTWPLRKIMQFLSVKR